MMKKYIYYFRYFLIAIGILLLLLGTVILAHHLVNQQMETERSNQECLTDERVFDYGDKLTEKQEEKLRKLIAVREKQIGSDIVIVTLNEELEAYAKSYEDKIGHVPMEDYVMVYADNFYDEFGFGYDKPMGDGAVYVDNWYRESDGFRYSWFSTSGKVRLRYSDDMVDHLIDRVIKWTNISPYYAYRTYVNTLYYDVCGWVNFTAVVPVVGILAVSLLIMGIYISVEMSGNKGKVTTTPNTYVRPERFKIRKQVDDFVTKRVSKRYISKGGGGSGGRSGGGGSHTSSSGGSHGGGGGRH